MNPADELERTLDEGLSYLWQQHHVAVPESARAALLQYVKLLAKWNRVYNLTAIRDMNAMVQRHLIDSLVLCRWLPGASSADAVECDVADIGSGAGLPGLPLAMVRPDLRVVSVESNGKKTRFQQQVLLELSISNVQIRHERVQDSRMQSRFVTSRAFTAPGDFLRIAEPLCADNAQVAIMLAHTEHLPEPLPGRFVVQELVPVHIPGSAGPRHVALCRRLA